MIKSELVKKIASRYPNMYSKEVKQILDVVFEEIAVSLSEGKRVELRGFGAFSVRKRNPRKARNPRTSKVVQVDGKYVAYFRTGKELKDRVDVAFKSKR